MRPLEVAAILQCCVLPWLGDNSLDLLGGSTELKATMLVALDLGNTNLTVGLFVGSQLKSSFRVSTASCCESKVVCDALRRWLRDQGVDAANISTVVLASVVPTATDCVQSAASEVFGCRVFVVGVDLLVKRPVWCRPKASVGVDRLVNAEAAWDRIEARASGVGVVVVDLGTATTLDCLSPGGDFLGGVIAPGIELGHRALVAQAAQLSAVPLRLPPQPVGTTTERAMQSGLLLGHACLVDGMVDRIQEQVGFPVVTVVTGGLCRALETELRRANVVDPDLTLHGLRVMGHAL